MDANELFPESQYLKSEDVDAVGEMLLTIKSVSRKEYESDDGKKEVKGELSFTETQKKLATNVTNSRTLATMFGSKDIDKTWVGKTITLYVDHNVTYGNKIVSGIRIRLIDPKQDSITAFWTEARKRGFTQQDGIDHLKEFGNDFAKALDALIAANPF